MTQFVIGIGSQRAGSTLLHQILDAATPVMMHPVKELHYFDSLHGIRAPRVLTEFSRRQLDREMERFSEATGPVSIPKRVGCYMRANWMLASTPVAEIDYRDLFAPFQNEPFVGETTPEYMLLDDEQVAGMAATVGKDAKIILITRDPLERFISAFKLLKVYGGGTVDKERFSDDLRRTLDEMPGWIDQQIALNDYEGATRRFRAHFDNVLVVEYEKLTQDMQAEAKRVADFVGVDIRSDDVARFATRRVNSIGETGSVREDVLDAARVRLGIR